MLTQLSIKHLAIVEQLELNFTSGMLVLTGETGAGKSILIDALCLVLGERASPSIIRAPHTQAEITACFDISRLPKILDWLKAHDLDAFDECIIRRIIKADGPSRAYVNGHIVPLGQLKSLGEHFVQIHSQHQHHALLNSEHQRQLLDEFANHGSLLSKVQACYQQWSSINQEIQELSDLQQQRDKLNLLNYQVQEIEELALQPNELQKLEQEHRQLAKSEELIATCQESLELLSGQSEQDIQSKMHLCVNRLASIQQLVPNLKNCSDLLGQALIQIEEANQELTDFLEAYDLNPERLQVIEQRLSAIHALSRKHRIAPEFIEEHYKALLTEKNKLAQAHEKLETLQQDLEATQDKYQVAAKKLSQSRIQTAKKLAVAIESRLKTLELPNAKFEIQVAQSDCSTPHFQGLDTVAFLVTTNPGQPLGPLKTIASGGELSRISLAIQVITAEKLTPPTLIFDEVDVGISGKTAQVVGDLMRQLGKNNQIICITHLPQVAAQGHHHFKVEKHQTKKETKTTITQLTSDQKIEELARLMGGLEVTPQALEHAKTMMESVI